MLRPEHNKLIYSFFSWYIARIIKSDFKNLIFNRVPYDPERAILLLANHFSWWDAFLLFHINRVYFRKKFHIMVTEENYLKVWFFKYLGAFSVKKNSRSIVESLEYSGGLLNDPANLVLIFPQGKLYSNHISQVNFEKGLLHIINSSAKKFQYLFVSAFVDYFEHRKPAVTCYFGGWEAEEHTSLQLIKNAYNKHYENSRRQQERITV